MANLFHDLQDFATDLQDNTDTGPLEDHVRHVEASMRHQSEEVAMIRECILSMRGKRVRTRGSGGWRYQNMRYRMAPRRGSTTDGRDHIVENFISYSFPEGQVSEDDFVSFEAAMLPTGFIAPGPVEGESINSLFEDWIAFPLAHFDAGIRLPLWLEVCQTLRYLGLVHAQLNMNVISMLLAFSCHPREERVEFNLDVFLKIFTFRASSDGVGIFA